MSCQDVRAQLSALVDDDLDPARRMALAAHLAGCPECRRELDRLRATVAALGRLPPARAPAGLVDRVMAAVYPRPWYRRLAHALFVPFRVKLPLEAAAAVVLVAASAVYLAQRGPEVARETREAPGPPLALAPPGPPGAPGAAGRPAEGPPAPAGEPRVEGAIPASPPASGGQGERGVPASPPAARSAAESLAIRPREEVARQAAPAAPPSREASRAPGTGLRADPVPSPGSGGRAGAEAERRAEAPERDAADVQPLARAHEAMPPALRPDRALAATAAAPASRPVPDATGRLVVPARGEAEAAVEALGAQIGATRLDRRAGGAAEPVILELLVPAGRYGELAAGLGQIGRWEPAREPAASSAPVRVEIRIADAP